MNIIIAGGRSFWCYDMLADFCDKVIEMNEYDDVVIVSGTARGADRLGERYAQERRYPINKFPADWEGQGKSAGYHRNAEMADYSDVLIAFWDGTSKGTKHMIDIATAKGLRVHTMRY
jgi:hypothetical protein